MTNEICCQSITLNGVQVISRDIDRYVNATALCFAGNKKWNDYFKRKETRDIFEKISVETRIVVSKLVFSKRGRNAETWVHADIAIDLAQWVSVDFKYQVIQLVKREIAQSTEINYEHKFRKWHERLALNPDIPADYFCILHEAHVMVYHFIQAGIDVNEKTIPDISIGIGWAKHWKTNDLEKKYGQSKSFPHIYPSDFPQSKSNPQPANCYPIEALGDYRKWLKYIYIDSGKLQQYLQGKIKSNHIPISVANQLIENLNKKPTEITDARQ